MPKIPFPKCPHPNRPQHYEETSYEYFELACEECCLQWKREQHLLQMEKWRQSGAVFELNEYGRYTVFNKLEGYKPSNRPDGRWIVGSISKEEFQEAHPPILVHSKIRGRN